MAAAATVAGGFELLLMLMMLQRELIMQRASNLFSIIIIILHSSFIIHLPLPLTQLSCVHVLMLCCPNACKIRVGTLAATEFTKGSELRLCGSRSRAAN